MPPADDQVTSLTTIGGNTKKGPVAFTTTQWSVVLAAQGPTPLAQAALDKICRTYWRPFYGFERLVGRSGSVCGWDLSAAARWRWPFWSWLISRRLRRAEKLR